ncbi:MAG: hypothetical protein IIA72_11205 [Proteobacteria bacterium]|nr:hypothetical protein [Pseudomonadota bacterium]
MPVKESVKAILPASVVSSYKQLKKNMIRGSRGIIQVLGYNISRTRDYYSPLPSVSELKVNVKRWDKPNELSGIQYDVDAFKELFLKMLSQYYAEFSKFPEYDEIKAKGFGPGFPALDALTLYMMIRDRKPKQYIEVGAGLSTYYCSLAAEENRANGYPMQIRCIEPYPYEKLYDIPGIIIYDKEVQDIDISFFQELRENDVLFIDSSHILKIDGDIPFLYLEVLPNLNKGVLIHIHDIPFPYNTPYPPDLWIFEQDWPMFWNEAMVLQAFLCFNDKFRIVLSTPLLRFFEESILEENVPIYESLEQNPNAFSSIWIQKVA